MTDYIISDILRSRYDRAYNDGYYDGYDDGYDSGYGDGYRDGTYAGTPIDDSVKERIREQVDHTANKYKEDAYLDLETALNDPYYLFIVDDDLSVLNQDSATCMLASGDILSVARTPAPGALTVQMQVVTSKRRSCEAGSVVTVSAVDLQEMLNAFAERVDDGLNALGEEKGHLINSRL